MKRHILLAYGEKGFAQRLKAVLGQQGHTATILAEGEPPRARYDLIIQLAADPANLAEGTRQLLSKARRDRARLILTLYRRDAKLYEEAARFAQTLVEDAGRKNEVETVILNLARLYGPYISLKDSGALGHLVTEFAEGNLLTLYGGGKDRDYYLFTADALEGIAQAVERASPGESYALAPSVAVDSEAIARLLYELGGGRHEIKFHPGLATGSDKGEVPGKPLPEFKIKTPFQEGILTILKTGPEPDHRGFRLPRLRLPLINFKFKLPHPSRPQLVGSAIALLLLSPLLYLGGSAGLALANLWRLKSATESLDFPQAQKSASAAAKHLDRFGRWSPLARAGAEAARVAADLAKEGKTLTTLTENLLHSWQGGETAPQSAEEFRRLEAAFSAAESRLTLAWLETRQEDRRVWQSLRSTLESIFEEGLRAARFGSGLARGLPDLLGYEGERSYLLLFLNSAEIQPGGGRMGTFAHLKLSQGGIVALKFFNESDFLHIASPLRKSNRISALPDFSENAKAIADIFWRGEGEKVQGVIGVDLHFAQGLLALSGPMTLADFDNQEITAENFFEVTTREVESDFFPGTTKKKAFIQALGEGVLDKLFAVGRDRYGALVKLAWESLEERGLLLYFTHPAAAIAALENNFTGRIREAGGDYLYPYDHNAGTKGTVWVDRSISYRVYQTDREGGLRAELKITWENEGTEAWPGGDYLNKTAVLAPAGAQLIEARRGDEDVLANFRSGLYRQKTQFSLPFDLQTYITVPPQRSQTLTLVYDLPENLGLKGSARYSLLVQKQPGTVSDNLRFVFEIPLGYDASSSNLQKIDNQLLFEGALNTDLEFEIELKER